MNTLPKNQNSAAADRDVVGQAQTLGRKLGAREAAAYLNVSKSWIDKRRVFGGGPRYHKLGRRVTYSIADLEDFAVRNRRQNTSERADD